MLKSSKLRSLIGLGRRAIVTPTHPERYRHGAVSGGRTHTNELRKASRGGQDLAHRYVRLENSLRGKEAVSNELEAFASYDSSVPSSTPAPLKPLRKSVEMFRGFVVPEEPKPPADDECCMSGCAVCVYDLHEEALEAYKQSLTSLRTSLAALGIPESEWPLRVQTKKGSTSSEGHPARRNEVVLSAFEEMERRLAQKKQAESPAPTSLPHWKQRQRLAALKKDESRDIVAELYEGIRWVLFSGR